MTEQEKGTVKQPVAGEPEGSPSQPENPETPNEETQDPPEGVEEKPGVEAPEEEKPAEEKPPEEELDETGVPLKNRILEKERIIEKLKKEVEEAKSKPADKPFDKEAFLDGMSAKYKVDRESLSSWLPVIQEVAMGMTQMSIDPLRKRLAKSDYELQKSELKRHPEYAPILADREIEKLIDEEAAKLPNADWSNPQALQSITRFVLGDPKTIARLMAKKGAGKPKVNKTIDAPNALAGGSKPAPVKTGNTLTAAEKEICRKMKISEEDYIKYK